jgi:hypothetical protein
VNRDSNFIVKDKRRNRDLFAAVTSGFAPRICEGRTDGSVSVLLWSRLSPAERKRGKEFVQMLAPDAKGGFCAWKSPNRPKSVEEAKALEEFVAAVERRHGAEIWVR